MMLPNASPYLGLILILAGVGLAIVAVALGVDDNRKSGRMPLQEAVKSVYGEFRHAIEKAYGIADFWSDPETALGRCAPLVVDMGGETLTIYGVYPPAEKLEKIPREDAASFQFSGDATELRDPLDASRRWANLRIDRKDFERRWAQLRADYGGDDA